MKDNIFHISTFYDYNNAQYWYSSRLVPHVKSLIPLVKSTSIPLDQACGHHGTTSGF